MDTPKTYAAWVGLLSQYLVNERDHNHQITHSGSTAPRQITTGVTASHLL